MKNVQKTEYGEIVSLLLESKKISAEQVKHAARITPETGDADLSG